MLLIESLVLQCFAIALGACIGSFLNVIIYRVPAGLSILHPPSRCPHCLRQLAPRDNIPIIGWFLIRGKCRYCHTPVSWRYPAIEALTAFLFWSVAAYFGTSIPILTLCFYAAFLSWLLVLAMIDIDTMTLPNSLTQSGLVLGFVYQASLASINSGDRTNLAGHLLNGILGAVAGVWVLDVMLWTIVICGGITIILITILSLICRSDILGGLKGAILSLLGKIWRGEAMGGGDPKLMAMIGVWIGWQKILLVMLLSAGLGSFTGVIGIVTGKLGFSVPTPYGVSIAIAAGLTLFFGDVIISNYLGWFGII